MIPGSKNFFIENPRLYNAVVAVYLIVGLTMFGLSIVGGGLSEGLRVLMVQLLLGLLIFILHRRFRYESLGSPSWRGFQWAGALMVVYLLFLFVLDRAVAWMHFPSEQLWSASLTQPVFWISVIVAPIVEEFFFRDLLFRVLGGEIKNTSLALVISSVAFMIAHMSLYPGALLLGVVNGGLLMKTRSLWPCIAFHVLSNATLVILPLWFPSLASALIHWQLFHSFYQ